MNLFENDVCEAKINLKREKYNGFWKKLLTLGLLDNDSKITEAQHYLDSCSHDLCRSKLLQSEADDIDQFEETIILKGIRVSKYTFADARVLGRDDYPQDWQQLRVLILERDSFCCQEEDGCCSGPLQIHHVLELSKGGSNNASNLITLCKYHHSTKHSHMQRKF